MLGKLVDKAGGHVPFPLVLADATQMPFPGAAFGGAYLRWVLHLIPDWRAAVGEMVRVVRPSGIVLANLGGYDETRFRVQTRFAELTGVSTDPVGLFWTDVDSLDAEMATHGTHVRVLPPVHESGEDTLGDFLEGIDEGRWSWTWPVPEDVRRGAVAEIRPWAAERFGPLDRVERYEFETVWRAYDIPHRRS